MPISYQIDHQRRLVSAQGIGVLTDRDVFGYQLAVWSRPDVVGFDELIDMTAVEKIVVPSGSRIRDLAGVSAAMDGLAQSKLAIIAPADLAFGMGRMYETYRELENSTKTVRVFRSREEALAYLGVSFDD